MTNTLSAALMPRLKLTAQAKALVWTLAAGLLLSACHDQSSVPQSSAAKADYVAMARGKVDVEGGLLDLVAPENAIFSQVYVHVGDLVKRDQPLAQLDAAAEQLELSQQQTALEQAKAQQSLQALHLPAAALAAKRWQKAAGLGAAQQQQADDAMQAERQAQAENSIALAAVHSAEQKVAEAEYALQKRTIRAPQAGEVITVRVQQGSALTSEQRVAFTLLPSRPIIVRAEVSESFINRIKLGMKAGLLPDSASTIAATAPIAAHVSQIGKVYEPAHLNSDAVQQNSRVIVCLLTLDAAAQHQLQTQHLLIGQNVLVKFYE